MTNHERYQAAFSQVHAPAGAARRALEHLDSKPSAPVRRRRPLRAVLICAAVAAALTVTVGAEVTTGSVSNLFAPLYGGAQTELVDRIGRPVDASATVGGYTLTAEAVIGDRYNIALVYTLTRDDGAPIPEGIRFGDQSNSVLQGSGGGSLSYRYDEELPENQIRIVEKWTSSGSLLFHRNAQVVFEDLYQFNPPDDSLTLLAEGTWELRFTVRYQDTTVSVPARDLSVTNEAGTVFQVRKILLSPLGLHMDLTASNPSLDSMELARNHDAMEFSAALVLQDGTWIGLGNANFGASGTEGERTARADYGAFFDRPIPLEEVAELVICDVTVPVELS